MSALVPVVAYLALGSLCTGLLRWRVEPGCPALIRARFVGSMVLALPIVCLIYRKWPWTMTLEVRSEPRR